MAQSELIMMGAGRGPTELKRHNTKLGCVVRWGKAKSRCYRQRMVTGSYEANLVANVDEVGAETKLGHGAEGDEHKKIWVVSRLEGGHLGGGGSGIWSNAAVVTSL